MATMPTKSQLAKMRKDDIIGKFLETTNTLTEAEEKTLGAAIIGGIAGCLLGLALG